MERNNKKSQTEDARRQNDDERGTGRRDENGHRRWLPLQGYGLHPMDMLRRYTHEMDRMFDNMNLGLGNFGSRWPAIEVFDRGDDRVIRAEMPGMKREDVKVRVVGDILVIEGNRRVENEETREGVHRSEWTYGQFSREIPIPSDLDATKLTAQMKNGVLELAMPYKEERRAREIEIKGEGPMEQAGFRR